MLREVKTLIVGLEKDLETHQQQYAEVAAAAGEATKTGDTELQEKTAVKLADHAEHLRSLLHEINFLKRSLPKEDDNSDEAGPSGQS